MAGSDAELVARGLAGDGRAYEKLVDRYRPAVYGLAYHRTGDPEEAEDLAQEVLVQAYVSLGQLRDPRRLGSWLASITHNACSKRAAAKQREGRAAPPPQPTDDRRRAHVRETVREALSHLPETQRLALILHCVDGYSHDEIGGFLDVPKSTVSGRIYRAKQRLRSEMMELVTTTVQADEPGERLMKKVLAEVGSFAEMDFAPDEGPLHLTPHGERTCLIFPCTRRAGFEVQYTEYEPGHDWGIGAGERTWRQRHLTHDVVYVVLHGELRMQVADDQRTLRTEESMYLPWGTPHAFVPVGAKGLAFMTVGVCRPDEALAHYEGEAKKRPPEPRVWEDLALACEAIACSVRPKVLDRAIEAWRQWIELSEQDPKAAAALARRRKWVEALRRVGVAIFD